MGTELQLGWAGRWVGFSGEMLWGWVGSEGTDGRHQGTKGTWCGGWKRQSNPLGRVGGWDLPGDRGWGWCLAERHGTWGMWKGRVGEH